MYVFTFKSSHRLPHIAPLLLLLTIRTNASMHPPYTLPHTAPLFLLTIRTNASMRLDHDVS